MENVCTNLYDLLIDIKTARHLSEGPFLGFDIAAYSKFHINKSVYFQFNEKKMLGLEKRALEYMEKRTPAAKLLHIKHTFLKSSRHMENNR